MKPLTKTVVSRGGGIAARFAPTEPKPEKAEELKPREPTEPKPRYARWREANPVLYKQRQAEYMRKRRAKEREK